MVRSGSLASVRRVRRALRPTWDRLAEIAGRYVGKRTARIRAEVAAAEAADGPGGGWLVPLTVRNEGGTAAVSIVVEGTANVAGTEESSELAIDLLAADSEVELVLGFSGKPDGEVQVRVVGFEMP